MTEFSFKSLTENVGSEVMGLDMRKPLDDCARDRLERELADRSVLLVRGQTELTPKQHIAFSRCFGPLEDHVLQNFCLPGHPEIFVVSNIVENGKHIGAYGGSKEYHSDLAYLPEPSMGSVFHCLECPEEGGETAIVSMSAVYEALSAERRGWLSQKRAVFDYVWQYERAHRDRPALTDEQKERVPPIGHPAVRTHPVNGKPALFLSEIWVRRFEGLDDEESQMMIRDILDFATSPEFTYVHKWRPGDVIIWDNRNSMHKACPFDETNTRRRMHRTTIKGSVPFFQAKAA
ncbi:MAG: taurine dioxygenase [Rhodospirillaceae bacterium]|jgi:taurine dioxygenase|nr:taurine dioxygenase [Rhodospirillaceae bacterium]|tara:strand:+ start:121 stop:990 length:870 start_codon:yes stop_codon:yes gene_type:complete